MNAKDIAISWGRQVLLNYLKSRTATAAAGGSALVVMLPKLIDFLGAGGVPNQTQIIVGCLIGAYIVARGLADHGKEATLMDMRKNLMLALGNGTLNAAKTEAFHTFIETGDMKGLLKVLEDEALKAAAEEAEGEDKSAAPAPDQPAATKPA